MLVARRPMSPVMSRARWLLIARDVTFHAYKSYVTSETAGDWPRAGAARRMCRPAVAHRYETGTVLAHDRVADQGRKKIVLTCSRTAYSIWRPPLKQNSYRKKLMKLEIITLTRLAET